MSIIVSGQYGDVESGEAIGPLQLQLNRSFEAHMTGRYFKSLAELSIIFRVSGNLVDYRSEGPERMRLVEKRTVLTIDLVFPESS